MTQGIRNYSNAKFAELLPQFTSNALTGTQFRAAVMVAVQEQFKIGVNPSATHYNYSLKIARREVPELVANLGREEGKKGGRAVTKPVNLYMQDGTLVHGGISMNKAKEFIDAAPANSGMYIEPVLTAAPLASVETPAPAEVPAVPELVVEVQDTTDTITPNVPGLFIETLGEAKF